MNFEKKFNILFSLTLFLWGALFFISKGYQHIEPLSLIGELIFDIFILTISWRFFYISTVNYKWYFLLFFISFVGIFLANLNYSVVFYVRKVVQPSPLEGILYMMPYFCFCLFQILFWLKITVNFIIKNKVNFLALLPYFFSSMAVFIIYIIASLVLVKNFTYVARWEMLIGAMDLLLSYLVILALICSRNKGLYLIALALSMIVATNFWWMYLYHNQALGVADYSTSFWFLALILLSFGLGYINKTQSLNLSSWFGSLRGIKSQVTLWTFSLAILSVLALCLLGRAFNLIDASIIESLPFLIMLYSVLVILTSNYVGNVFERPFKKVQNAIEIFMNGEEKIIAPQFKFHAEEFSFLQKFIVDSFGVFEERSKEKKAIADLALQVAHDIRSPVAAISMIAKECLDLPEKQRIAMRDAAYRIQDIADYLLSKYSNSSEISTEPKPLLISTAVLSVLAEKRMQFKGSDINFLYDAADDTHFIFVIINDTEFKRILSNLINNAVEASDEKGEVTVTLIKDSESVTITISDTGKGMSPEMLTQLETHNKILSNKHTGTGLGLSHAYSILRKYDANLHIQSKVDCGTQVTLTFKAASKPIWITNKIELKNDDHIIILDDDNSIHTAWDEMLSTFLKENENLTIIHFTHADKCIDYINGLNNPDGYLLLVDYELIKQGINGLDVIGSVNAKRAILVTSYYENSEIIKKAILLNTQILPKILAFAVNITQQPINRILPDFSGKVDLVVIEDNREFADILIYLYMMRGKKMHIYYTPYELLENLNFYNEQTKICTDYNLGCYLTGVELAEFLNSKGYNNLYLATGMLMENIKLPNYLQLLKEKMDLLNL